MSQSYKCVVSAASAGLEQDARMRRRKRQLRLAQALSTSDASRSSSAFSSSYSLFTSNSLDRPPHRVGALASWERREGTGMGNVLKLLQATKNAAASSEDFTVEDTFHIKASEQNLVRQKAFIDVDSSVDKLEFYLGELDRPESIYIDSIKGTSKGVCFNTRHDQQERLLAMKHLKKGLERFTVSTSCTSISFVQEWMSLRAKFFEKEVSLLASQLGNQSAEAAAVESSDKLPVDEAIQLAKDTNTRLMSDLYTRWEETVESQRSGIQKQLRNIEIRLQTRKHQWTQKLLALEKDLTSKRSEMQEIDKILSDMGVKQDSDLLDASWEENAQTMIHLNAVIDGKRKEIEKLEETSRYYSSETDYARRVLEDSKVTMRDPARWEQRRVILKKQLDDKNMDQQERMVVHANLKKQFEEEHALTLKALRASVSRKREQVEALVAQQQTSNTLDEQLEQLRVEVKELVKQTEDAQTQLSDLQLENHKLGTRTDHLKDSMSEIRAEQHHRHDIHKEGTETRTMFISKKRLDKQILDARVNTEDVACLGYAMSSLRLFPAVGESEDSEVEFMKGGDPLTVVRDLGLELIQRYFGQVMVCDDLFQFIYCTRVGKGTQGHETTDEAYIASLFLGADIHACSKGVHNPPLECGRLQLLMDVRVSFCKLLKYSTATASSARKLIHMLQAHIFLPNIKDQLPELRKVLEQTSESRDSLIQKLLWGALGICMPSSSLLPMCNDLCSSPVGSEAFARLAGAILAELTGLAASTAFIAIGFIVHWAPIAISAEPRVPSRVRSATRTHDPVHSLSGTPPAAQDQPLHHRPSTPEEVEARAQEQLASKRKKRNEHKAVRNLEAQAKPRTSSIDYTLPKTQSAPKTTEAPSVHPERPATDCLQDVMRLCTSVSALVAQKGPVAQLLFSALLERFQTLSAGTAPDADWLSRLSDSIVQQLQSVNDTLKTPHTECATWLDASVISEAAASSRLYALGVKPRKSNRSPDVRSDCQRSRLDKARQARVSLTITTVRKNAAEAVMHMSETLYKLKERLKDQASENEAAKLELSSTMQSPKVAELSRLQHAVEDRTKTLAKVEEYIRLAILYMKYPHLYKPLFDDERMQRLKHEVSTLRKLLVQLRKRWMRLDGVANKAERRQSTKISGHGHTALATNLQRFVLETPPQPVVASTRPSHLTAHIPIVPPQGRPTLQRRMVRSPPVELNMEGIGIHVMKAAKPRNGPAVPSSPNDFTGFTHSARQLRVLSEPTSS